MSKSCVVINIQNNFQAFGLRLKAVANGKYCIEKQFAGAYPENDGPGEVLQRAMSSLNTRNCDRIILTGQIEQSGVFEISMPELGHDELRNAIEYELVKYLPLSLNDIIWSARIVPDDDEDTQKNFVRLRIVFMKRDNWTKFVSELQIRQLNLDAYINPFMCIDSFAAGQNVALPMIDDEHVFLSNAKGLREMSFDENMKQNEDLQERIFDYFVWNHEIPEKNELQKYFVCMLVARYVMSGEYDKYEKKLAVKLPHGLLPQRNKLLKLFSVINGIAALLCLTLFLYQEREKVHRVYVEQKNAINLRQTQMRNLQNRNALSKKNEKLYKKILGAVPANLKPLRILSFFARKLPKYIWIRSYNMTADKIHLSLTSSRDPGNLLSSLRNEKLYNIENIRKSRRYDGTYYLYLMLASPESAGERK